MDISCSVLIHLVYLHKLRPSSKGLYVLYNVHIVSMLGKIKRKLFNGHYSRKTHKMCAKLPRNSMILQF